MKRMLARLIVAAGLIAAGWAVGSAQATQPDFELLVNAPTGETRVECLRGCELSWVERGVNPNSSAQPTFSFRCGAANGCSSARIGGWVRR